MWPVFSWSKPEAVAKVEPSQEKEKPGCPGVCWAGEARSAHLPCGPTSLLTSLFLSLLPSPFFPPSSSPSLTPPNFFFPLSTSSLLQSLPGCSLGIAEGLLGRAWANSSYFTSHVFILMGIREKLNMQLVHQGFIS